MRSSGPSRSAPSSSFSVGLPASWGRFWSLPMARDPGTSPSGAKKRDGPAFVRVEVMKTARLGSPHRSVRRSFSSNTCRSLLVSAKSSELPRRISTCHA